jgi:uncharacterized protein (DUF1330 family)
MPAYLIVEIDIHNLPEYEEYIKLAPPSIALYGGRYLVRGGKIEVLEGDWNPKRFVIVEFPDAEKAKQWWSSDEYAKAKIIRQRAADTKMILVEGLQH